MSTVDSQRIRQILRDHAQLSIDVDLLDDGDDLFDAGMNSRSAVDVMLGLEAGFDIEFPESMLTRSVFESVVALDAAVRELRAEAA
jgi:acyl carrier protein